MKRLALIVMLVLSACSPSAQAIQTAIAQTQAAGISGDLKTKLNTLLEDGSRLSAMTEQGVTFSDFSQQLANAKGDYDLAFVTSSPKSIAAETKTELDKAFTGWALALQLWSDKNDPVGFSYEQNTELKSAAVAYAGVNNLKFGENQQFLFDPNISALLSIASGHWKAGQALLLAELK